MNLKGLYLVRYLNVTVPYRSLIGIPIKIFQQRGWTISLLYFKEGEGMLLKYSAGKKKKKEKKKGKK